MLGAQAFVPPLNDSTVVWHFGCMLPKDADARP
jgi:hypothetical protein